MYLKRKLLKKCIKKSVQNGFIRRLKNDTLNFNFVMIHIVHKILVLIKNNNNYIKYNLF